MIKIGITQSEIAFHNYPRWMLEDNCEVEVVILDFDRNNINDLDQCQGVLLSGGVDIHPSYYNESRFDYPLAPIFDQRRDEFELKIFNLAYTRGLPLLGICRGMQLMNVALGGNLIQDLEEEGKNNHRKNEQNDGQHGIEVAKNTHFLDSVGVSSGIINTAHHQGIRELSNELTQVAWSEDGVIEAVELKDFTKHPYFLGVQWHPERFMHDTFAKPFSTDIKNSFFNACSIK
jgi:putative glutamine amidotransferase